MKQKICKICGSNFYAFGCIKYCCDECVRKGARMMEKKWEKEHKYRRAIITKRCNEKNRIKRRSYIKKWLKGGTASNYKIGLAIRSRIRHALKGKDKSANTTNLLGCSVNYLIDYLSDQFIDGMSWDNWGEWHIDHIKPCCKFNLIEPEQQKQCFNFSNLQPLWAKDNLSKGGK